MYHSEQVAVINCINPTAIVTTYCFPIYNIFNFVFYLGATASSVLGLLYAQMTLGSTQGNTCGAWLQTQSATCTASHLDPALSLQPYVGEKKMLYLLYIKSSSQQIQLYFPI